MRLFKRSLLLCAVLAITFSCSKDEAPAPNNDIELASGTYALIALNINPAQDVNDDGNTTSNVVSELPCATGTLTLQSDATWTWTSEIINITAITGGLYKFNCTSTKRNQSGIWQIQNSQITLSDSANTTIFVQSGELLTNTTNEDLPFYRSLVYEKQ